MSSITVVVYDIWIAPVVPSLRYYYWHQVPGPPTAETNVQAVNDFRPPQFSPARYTINRALFTGDQAEGGVVASTPTHSVARFSPTRYLVNVSLRQCAATDFVVFVAPETNPHFVPSFRGAAYVVSPALRQCAAVDFLVPPQPETNTQFVAAFSGARYLVSAQLRQAPANDVPLAESGANYHFVGSFRPTSLAVDRRLVQRSSNDVPPPPPVVEAQPHHLARYQPARLTIYQGLRHWQACDQAVTEASVSVAVVAELSTPAVTPAQVAQLYLHRPALDVPPAVQVEASAHALARFAQARYLVSPGLRQDPARDSPLIESGASPHFVGKFSPATLGVSRGLYQDGARDVPPAAVQVEAASHFLGKFATATLRVPRDLYQNPSLDPAVDGGGGGAGAVLDIFGVRTNPAAIGNLYRAQAVDFAVATVPETNVHAPLKFAGASYKVSVAYRQNAATDFVAASPETGANPHYLARYQPTQLVVYQGLRHWQSCDFFTPESPSATSVVEVRSAQAVDAAVAIVLRNPATDLPLRESAANPHFIYKFKPQTLAVDRNLTRGLATDVPAAVVVPETNPHFLGRYTPAKLATPQFLRHWQGSDFSTAESSIVSSYVEVLPQSSIDAAVAIVTRNPATDQPLRESGANPHHIGKFSPARLFALPGLRQREAVDFIIPPQPTTDTYVTARFVPAKYLVSVQLRQDPARDSPLRESAANPHHVGAYRSAQLAVPPALRQDPAHDSPLRESAANSHTVARFAQSQIRVDPGLRQNSANDVPIPPQIEAQPHFLGTFRPQAYTRFNYNQWDTRVPQVETNVHSLAKFQPARILVNRALFTGDQAEGGRVVETNPHYLARHRPAQYQWFRYNLTPQDFSQPPIGGEPHFLATYRPTEYTLLRDSWMRPAADVSLLQPDPRFGRATAPRHLGRLAPPRSGD